MNVLVQPGSNEPESCFHGLPGVVCDLKEKKKKSKIKFNQNSFQNGKMLTKTNLHPQKNQSNPCLFFLGLHPHLLAETTQVPFVLQEIFQDRFVFLCREGGSPVLKNNPENKLSTIEVKFIVAISSYLSWERISSGINNRYIIQDVSD